MWWVVGVVGALGLLVLAVVVVVLNRLAPPKPVDYSAEFGALLNELHPEQSGLAPEEAAGLLVELAELHRNAERGLQDRIVAERVRRRTEFDEASETDATVQQPKMDLVADLSVLYEPPPDVDPFEIQLAQDLLASLEATAFFEHVERLREAKSLMTPERINVLLIPEVDGARNIARALCARADALWKAGDFAGALESHRLNSHLAALIESGHGLIWTLVSVALWDIEHGALRTIAQSDGADEAALAAIEAHVRSYDAVPDIASMLRGDRLWTRSWIQNEMQQEAPGWDDQFGIEDRLRHPLSQRNRQIDDMFARAGAIADQTPAQLRASGPHQKFSGISDELISASESSMFKTMERAHAGETSRRALLIVIALERHRLARGVYPDSLEALVPEFIKELPRDPYADDGRFIYQRVPASNTGSGDGAGSKAAETYRLHSVWADGVDNSGTQPADLDYSPVRAQPPVATPAEESE